MNEDVDASLDAGLDATVDEPDADAATPPPVDAGADPSPFIPCTASPPFPAIEAFDSVFFGTAKIGATTYVYAMFEEGGFDNNVYRYALADGPGCTLTRDTTFGTNGKLVHDNITQYVDATGAIWSDDNGSATFTERRLVHEYPGTPFSCTFDAALGAYKYVDAIAFDELGTTGFVKLGNGSFNSEQRYGKVTVTATSCSIAPLVTSNYPSSETGVGFAPNGQYIVPDVFGLHFYGTNGAETSYVQGFFFTVFGVARQGSGLAVIGADRISFCGAGGTACTEKSLPRVYDWQRATSASHSNTPFFTGSIVDDDRPTRRAVLYRAP